MISDFITIRPISADEWLPDRCLNGIGAFDPNSNLPEPGCPGLSYTNKYNREGLAQLYRKTIDKYGGCRFVAWDKDKVVAYHNFFPLEVAQKLKFYGYGFGLRQRNKTLIHNCLTIVKGSYLHKGISSQLVRHSINWARENNWERFEVHFVLLDCDLVWQYDQKSCLSFWKKFGFEIFDEYEADEAAKQFYGIPKRYSMYLSLDKGVKQQHRLTNNNDRSIKKT